MKPVNLEQNFLNNKNQESNNSVEKNGLKYLPLDFTFEFENKGEVEFSPDYTEAKNEYWKAYVEKAKENGVDVWNGKTYFIQGEIDFTKPLPIVVGDFSDLSFRRKMGNKYLIETFGDPFPLRHISNACTVVTSDKKIIFGVKKKATNGFAKDVLYYPSGVASPDDRKGEGISNFKELFEHNREELFEETGIIEACGETTPSWKNITDEFITIGFSTKIDVSAEEILPLLKKDDEFYRYEALTPEEFSSYKGALIGSMEILRQNPDFLKGII